VNLEGKNCCWKSTEKWHADAVDKIVEIKNAIKAKA
jgi:hypothetical protein